MHGFWTAIAVLGVSVAATGGARAQQAPAPASRPATKQPALDRVDRGFMQAAAKGAMAEVALGELASTRASDDGVRKFGRRMVDHHGKANQELAQLARDKGVELPKEVDRTQKGIYDRLATLSGQAFDRAYVEEMIQDHRNDVKEFGRAAGRAKDPDLKTWADNMVPTLRDHLREIENLSAKVLARK